MITPFLISLACSIAAALPVVHPHHPMAIPVATVHGKAVITYQTVPFNKEKVYALPNGRSWHLAIAFFNNDIPLEGGGTVLPPGRWKFNARRNDQGEFAAVEFVHPDIYRLSRRGTKEAIAAKEKELQEKGQVGRVIVPLNTHADKDIEHLEITVRTRGYPTPRVGQTEAIGGTRFTVYLDFGDLHRNFDMTEVMPKEAGKDGGT